MVRYAFKDGVVAIPNAKKADPQKIGEAMDKIRSKTGGELTPRATWKACEGNRRHVLYKHFEWDNEKCGEHWRDQQARILINSITVLDDYDEKQPAYFNVRDDLKRRRSYRSNKDVLDSEKLQLSILKDAKRDLEAWKWRYQQLKDICDLVHPAEEELDRRIRRESEESRATA